MATFGLQANMILYLTKRYHLTAATSTIVLYNWSAVSNFLPISGAVLADAYLGRFRVIAIGSVVSLMVIKQINYAPFPFPDHDRSEKQTAELNCICMAGAFGAV